MSKLFIKKNSSSIPGPRSQAWRERENQFLAPGLQGFAQMAGIVVNRAWNAWVEDVDGNVFLDWIGGIGVGGIGHSHPHWVEALKKQLDQASVGSFTSKARVLFLEKLARYQPSQDRWQLQWYSSGAEAVESALRLAKSYTQKYEFVSFWGGFHGKTMGVLSLMGSSFKHELGPLVPGCYTVPYADCYRCPLKLNSKNCNFACVEILRELLKSQTSGKIAALLVEPMQGTAGNVIPPVGFLEAVSRIAQEHHALLIADEMITGFGRTGKFWGHAHSGIEPDVITLGKQFGGGFPVSAVYVKASIAKALPWAKPSGSSSSYGGNPMAAQAALAALEVIEQEHLVQKSKENGSYLLSLLKDFEKFPFVGAVRGSGLFLGIELVSNRETKRLLSKKSCRWIFDQALQRGLLTMAYSPRFRIQPPMVIGKEALGLGAEILEQVFSDFLNTDLWKKESKVQGG